MALALVAPSAQRYDFRPVASWIIERMEQQTMSEGKTGADPSGR